MGEGVRPVEKGYCRFLISRPSQTSHFITGPVLLGIPLLNEGALAACSAVLIGHQSPFHAVDERLVSTCLSPRIVIPGLEYTKETGTDCFSPGPEDEERALVFSYTH